MPATSPIYLDSGNQPQSARGVFLLDQNGSALASAPIVLLANASATGSDTAALSGGRYLWSAAGTFNGAILTLQSLGADGATRQDVASINAATPGIEVLVGVGEVLRVAVSGGTPTGLYSTLRKVS